MSFEDREGFIWMDGRMVPWADARVHVLSHTFLCGTGVFEGVRAYDGPNGAHVFRLADHTQRLYDSAKIIQLAIPYSRETLITAQLAVISANQLSDCYLRPVVYLDGANVGVSAAGNGVHVLIAAWQWGEYLGAGAQQNGIHIKTSSFVRQHVNASMAKAKVTGYYVNSMLAVTEARQLGFQDALLLDTQGHVAECSTSNIFMVKGKRIATPERTAVLQGITRDTVIELVGELDLEFQERNITRDELYVADEVFITGTAAEITPVVSIDKRLIGAGDTGPVTRSIQAAFLGSVRGEVAARRNWLTAVRG